jgi:hypothetical protein
MIADCDKYLYSSMVISNRIQQSGTALDLLSEHGMTVSNNTQAMALACKLDSLGMG